MLIFLTNFRNQFELRFRVKLFINCVYAFGDGDMKLFHN